MKIFHFSSILTHSPLSQYPTQGKSGGYTYIGIQNGDVIGNALSPKRYKSFICKCLDTWAKGLSLRYMARHGGVVEGISSMVYLRDRAKSVLRIPVGIRPYHC